MRKLMIANLNQKQNSLHKLINSFLNGDYYDTRTRLLGKYWFSGGDQFWRDFEEFRILMGIPKSELTYSSPNELMAELIVNSYSSLKVLIREYAPNLPIEQVNVPSFDDPKLPLEIVSIYALLNDEQITDCLSCFFVHGSFGSHEQVQGVSDIDLLLILNEAALVSVERLVQLQTIIHRCRYFLYENDPLQHHGIFILLDIDLDYYPQHFFPTQLFKHGYALMGSGFFDFRIRDDAAERQAIFDATLDYLIATNPMKIDSLYHKKIYLSVVQLLPIAYLQKQGIFMYKKYSFDTFYTYFPAFERINNICLRIRSKWKPNFVVFPSLGRFLFNVFGLIYTWYFINRILASRISEIYSNEINDTFHKELKIILYDIKGNLN